MFEVLIPLKIVAAQESEVYTSPLHYSHSDNLIFEQLYGQEPFDQFQNNKDSANNPQILKNSLIKASGSQLDILSQDDDSQYHILWSYYHDSEHIFKDTCTVAPYDLVVDSEGNLIFTHKNNTNMTFVSEERKLNQIPQVILKYNIKKLLEESPAILPGLEDTIFTVSINNNQIMAINPNGQTQSTSLNVKNHHPERFEKDTIFLHK